VGICLNTVMEKVGTMCEIFQMGAQILFERLIMDKHYTLLV
jgi:hypothetical protein